MPLSLHVKLWPLPGRHAELSAYEDAVLALLPRHGGRVLVRDIVAAEPDDPYETQVIEFADRAGFDAFLSDPRRLALAAERDAAVARTELVEEERSGRTSAAGPDAPDRPDTSG